MRRWYRSHWLSFCVDSTGSHRLSICIDSTGFHRLSICVRFSLVAYLRRFYRFSLLALPGQPGLSSCPRPRDARRARLRMGQSHTGCPFPANPFASTTLSSSSSSRSLPSNSPGPNRQTIRADGAFPLLLGDGVSDCASTTASRGGSASLSGTGAEKQDRLVLAICGAGIACPSRYSWRVATRCTEIDEVRIPNRHAKAALPQQRRGKTWTVPRKQMVLLLSKFRLYAAGPKFEDRCQSCPPCCIVKVRHFAFASTERRHWSKIEITLCFAFLNKHTSITSGRKRDLEGTVEINQDCKSTKGVRKGKGER